MTAGTAAAGREGAAIGIVLGSEVAPEALREVARQVEEAAFAELWLAEDCFFTGGVAAASIALAATATVPVGLGVVSAVTRHPALLAMEWSTLARAYPGRFRPAVGLGVPAWLRQLGILPRSPLRAVRDAVTSVRGLLAGQRLSTAADGHTFHFEGVELAYPPAAVPPIAMGANGPRMLRLAGEVADGTLLSVLAGPAYVRWALERVREGAERAGRDPERHRVTVFALHAVADDRAQARAAVRRAAAFYLDAYLQGAGPHSLTDAEGITSEAQRLLAAGGVDGLARDMPDAWVDRIAVSGTPGDCARAIGRLREAGADAVCLFPQPAGQMSQSLAVTAREVVPLLSAGRS